MNKTLLTFAAAIAFGTLSNAVLAGDTLDQGDSSNYGQPHVAAAQAVRSAPAVADIGEAAAYPRPARAAEAVRAPRGARASVVADMQAADSAVYRAN